MSVRSSNPAELAVETDPDNPLDNFVPTDAIAELKASAQDSTWFMAQMQRNEETRLAWWTNKSGTGKKVTRPGYEATPWNNAADCESHLTQEVINKRNAMRVASLARGNLNVTPTEAGDSAAAGNMRTLMRYYLNGPMKTQVLTHGLRAGSWADRWGHSILYIGWREERGVEPINMTLDEAVKLFMEAQSQASQSGRSQGLAISDLSPDDYTNELLAPENEVSNAKTLAQLIPGLAARDKEGIRQARKALRVWRKDSKAKAIMHGSFVRRSAPMWEALVPFVDVFYPAEAIFDDNLENCRWVARVKWMSAQQLKEQAEIDDWDKDWLKQVLETKKGRSVALSVRNFSWALNGGGVRWTALNNTSSNGRTGGETQKHLYQIVEMWDRSMTSDGLMGTYHTVLHPDITEKVAKRKLREDWHGCLPFVAFTCEKDEKLLLASRGLPEFTMSPQGQIKAQYDSRTDAAALTTVPPWTGPSELAGMRPSPGKFLPQSRGGIVVQPWRMPPPDGRSIEIEQTLRDSVDRLFGLAGKAVPDAVSMAMGQADMDWFLASISQAVKLTAQLVQQYSPPLKNARIAGTDQVFSATPDDVRGAFDFDIKFDVRSLDLEWASAMLKFVKDMLLPLDRRGDIDTYPLMEVGFNLLDGSLTPRCLPGQQITQRRQQDEEHAVIADIFSGGTPVDVPQGIDYQGRAQVMFDDLRRSPERQQALMSSPQIFIVFQNRLETLLNNATQYGENVTTGQTLAPDPMKLQTPPEKLLAFMQSLKVDLRTTQPEQLIQALPYLQQVLEQSTAA